MRNPVAITVLLCVSVAFVVALQKGLPVTDRRSTDNVGLDLLSQHEIEGPPSNIRRAETPRGVPGSACAAAQAALGETIVQTKPLNQTDVENNW